MLIIIWEKSKKIFKHELINASFYMFIGGSFAGFLNFLFNFFLTRHISYSDYGIYSALIALVGLVSVPGQALTPTIISFSGEYFSKNEVGKAKEFYRQSVIYVFILSILFSVLLLLFSNFFISFFNLQSIWYLILACFIMTATFLSVIPGGYLQSLLRFKLFSSLTVINSIFKLILGMIFILIGFNLYGIFGALFIGAIVPFLVGDFFLRKLFFNIKKLQIKDYLKTITHYSLGACIICISITSFTTSDILLVKHYFSSDVAGLYGGLTVVGKIVYYIVVPIIGALFPILVNKFHKGERLLKTFILAFILVLIPSIFITLAYFIIPDFFLTIFLGGRKYLEMAKFLGWYGLYSSLFGVANVLVNYFLSKKIISIAYFTVSAAMLQIIGIIFFHTTILNIIIISISSLSLLILMLLIFLIYPKFIILQAAN